MIVTIQTGHPFPVLLNTHFYVSTVTLLFCLGITGLFTIANHFHSSKWLGGILFVTYAIFGSVSLFVE